MFVINISYNKGLEVLIKSFTLKVLLINGYNKLVDMND